MEGPGMSLFQGAASIHINNSAQDRLEEQEELEDQKRRNEELKHKLANAFDDLLDDDEASSVNSSGNFGLETTQANGCQQIRHGLPPTYIESLNHLKEKQHEPESPVRCEMINSNNSPHLRHQEDPTKLQCGGYGAGDAQNHYFSPDFRGHPNGVNNFDSKQEYMNNEQLKVMYEMRVKECQQLAGQMEKLDTEIDSLRARLGAAVTDRDKAELSLQEAHHLLASSKHKMIELEQQVSALTTKLIESDQEKEQLKLELRSTTVSLQEVQQKLHTLQVTRTHDTDALFREQQDRHRAEMDRYESDVIKFKQRLRDKEGEVKQLERRYKECEKEKEEIMVEKGATINKLALELELAQDRLMNGEASRMKEKVMQLTNERNTAREQVKELGSKLEITAHDLCLCRNKLSAIQAEHEKWRTTLQQILMEDAAEMGVPSSPGDLSTLKDVLTRYKNKVKTISTMQEEIDMRDKKLELYRKQESELRAKLDEYKTIEMQLQSQLGEVHDKVEQLSQKSDNEQLKMYKQQNEQLKAELNKIKDDFNALNIKHMELETKYEELKSESNNRTSQTSTVDLMKELERYSAKMRLTLEENGELKSLYLQACSRRESLMRELKEAQAKYLQDKELYAAHENEFKEELAKEKIRVQTLLTELETARFEAEEARRSLATLQKEFTDKQKEFAAKLSEYIEGKCTECNQYKQNLAQLQDQLGKAYSKLYCTKMAAKCERLLQTSFKDLED